MASHLEYIEPDEVVIEGIPATGMTICAATGRAVGRLRGFIVDATERHIRYLVVRGSGLFAKTTLLPFTMPRIDFDSRTIRVEVTDQQLWQLRNFTPDTILA